MVLAAPSFTRSSGASKSARKVATAPEAESTNSPKAFVISSSPLRQAARESRIGESPVGGPYRKAGCLGGLFNRATGGERSEQELVAACAAAHPWLLQI